MNMTEIFLNNKFFGEVDDAKKFIEDFVSARRQGNIDVSVNYSYDEDTDTIFIESSRGRLLRPVLVVRDGKPLITQRQVEQLSKGELQFTDLVKQGLVEYIDAAEEENCLIAYDEKDLTPEHTHLEISPMTILGVTAALVPFANFSHAVRIAQGAKNQKQAIGFYAANYQVRMDMDVNLLHHPQVPLVKSIIHDVSHYDEHPAGQNIIVAVMSFKGYNMDDAVIVNRGSVDRGLGRNSYFRPAVAEELRYAGGLQDQISIPDKDVRGYRSEHDYRFLEDDGIIHPEAKVAEGDVIIGKTSPPRFLSGMDEYSLTSNVRRESSVSLRHGEEGIVDLVLLSENGEGNRLVQVRLREYRIPEIGDKFTSRHGQKGVIGLLVNPSDMPFSASGIIPDLIFSPHGIPSRMTISHLIECLGGKVAALRGSAIDASIFSSEPEASLREQLASFGFREDGTEIFYDGETGRMMEARIFVGSMYYLRLKHMVANKLHSRGRGPIQLLTRQPTEGRAKEGGLRLGEMEKDTFVAHGASLLLKERFDADKVMIPVCLKSGLGGYYHARTRKLMSPIYGEDSELEYVEMSYAFKLLLDEIKSLGIYPRLVLEDKY
ncbi:DNA-directed RNA polymerase subunit B [Candidatus Woesearchaeota archaeon]|nr:MAG: DNA-directed RNA polymerase subunit B [Candidatus Woesearchaeota archaeon]